MKEVPCHSGLLASTAAMSSCILSRKLLGALSVKNSSRFVADSSAFSATRGNIAEIDGVSKGRGGGGEKQGGEGKEGEERGGYTLFVCFDSLG